MVETKEKSSTSPSKEEARDAKTLEQVEKDPRISLGPVRIQTAEDAREAYLREEISLEEFNAIRGKFGMSGEHLWVAPNRLEKPDAAFQRDLPEDMYREPGTAHLTVDQRIAEVEKKAEVRETATKASEEVEQEAKPETDLAVLRNRAAEKAAEDKQRELDELHGKHVEEAVSFENKNTK